MLCWKLCAPQFKPLAVTVYTYSLFIRQQYIFPCHTTTIHIPFLYDNNTYYLFTRQQYIFPFYTTIHIPFSYNNNTYYPFIRQQYVFLFYTITIHILFSYNNNTDSLSIRSHLPNTYIYKEKQKKQKTKTKQNKKHKKKKKTVNQFERKSSRTRRLGTYSEDEVRRNQAAYPRSLQVNTGAPLFRFVRRAHNAE